MRTRRPWDHDERDAALRRIATARELYGHQLPLATSQDMDDLAARIWRGDQDAAAAATALADALIHHWRRSMLAVFAAASVGIAVAVTSVRLAGSDWTWFVLAITVAAGTYWLLAPRRDRAGAERDEVTP